MDNEWISIPFAIIQTEFINLFLICLTNTGFFAQGQVSCHHHDPMPFLKIIIKLMCQSKNEINRATNSPIKILNIFFISLSLQARGMVINGVRNIVNSNICAIKFI